MQSPPETVKSPALEIQKVETGYLQDKEQEASVPEADPADLEVISVSPSDDDYWTLPSASTK